MAGIDVLSNENSGLMLERNVNVSNKFTSAVMKNLYIHKIMSVGKSSSRRSSTINHEMVHASWGIHPALAKNTVERMTQWGVRISCPHPFLTKRIQTNDRILLVQLIALQRFCRYIDFRNGVKKGKQIRGSFCDWFWLGTSLSNEKEKQRA